MEYVVSYCDSFKMEVTMHRISADSRLEAMKEACRITLPPEDLEYLEPSIEKCKSSADLNVLMSGLEVVVSALKL